MPEGAWQVWGLSRVGTSHLRLGVECQDTWDVIVRHDGRVVIALADGAGSARNAATGSSVAARAATSSLDIQLDEGVGPWTAPDADRLLRRAFHEARAALEWTAVEVGVALESLATTLILILADASATAVGQVGDGAVVVGLADELFVRLSAADHHEYANVTDFITAKDFERSMAVSFSSQSAACIIAFTDGLQRLALDRQFEPFSGFFGPIAKAAKSRLTPADIETLLSSPRVTSRSDDDLTLVVAARA